MPTEVDLVEEIIRDNINKLLHILGGSGRYKEVD